MTLRIKVVHSRWRCDYRLPVFSEGKNGAGIITAEEQCFLERGHQGPHRGPHGQVVINSQDMDMTLHGHRKLY